MAWLLAALLAIASAVEPVSWTDLEPAASASWARGHGAVYAAQRAGLSEARAAEPLGRLGFDGQVAPVLGSGDRRFDDNTQVLLTTDIGGRRGALRGWWQAQIAELDGAEAADRLAFLDRARGLWLDAWVAGALAEHLVEHADGLEAEIDILRTGLGDGLVARLTVDELSVEVGRLRAEAAMAYQRAEVARVALCAHLGRDVAVDGAGLPELEEALPDAPNPWEALISRAADFPQIQALRAQEAAAQAQARASRRSAPPTLGLGAIYRNPAYDAGPTGPVLTLGVPLENPMAPQARRADGEAEAARRARVFAEERQAALLRAEAAALRAAEARHALLRDRVEGPLTDRVARLSDALRQGHAPIHLVLLARRDLHEAFHSRADAAAEVLVRRARGQGLITWMNKEGAP